MRLPFEILIALRHLSPKRTFVSIITLLSLAGVVLGVMVLIVVISVMSGFEKALQEKVMGFNAHMTVTNHGILHGTEDLLETLTKTPGVKGASAFVAGPVLVEFNGRVSTPFVRGVDAEREESVMGLRRFVVEGEMLLQGEGVIIGKRYAQKNGIRPGDRISVISPRLVQSIRDAAKKGEQFTYLPDDMTVTGIFSTGMYDYDAHFILMALDTAQHLYDLGDGVHGISLKIENPMNPVALKNLLNRDLPPPVQAYSWMDLNRQLFSAVAVERNVMFFLLLFIVVVAAFGLSSTLITLTVQKSREIGLLKALGATSHQIMGIFIGHGLVVGTVGSGLGLACGLTVLRFRNEISQFLASTLGVEIFPQEVYQFAAIPAVVDVHNLFNICLSAIGICILAAWIPAWNAARLDPVQALRYE